MKKAKTTTQPIQIVDELSAKVKLEKRLFWLLMIAAFLFFLPTINHGFVLDDLAVIEQNKFVQQGFGGIDELLTTFYWKGYWDANSGLYRPLSMILFAIEWAISPNNPALHHFVNIVLHALSIGILFRLLAKLLHTFPIWIPFLISVLFLVHPTHSEVVANIKSRDEILCFLFFLLTLKTIVLEDHSKWTTQVKIVVYFFLCLFSKEAGIMFLPIIMGYFFFIQRLSVMSILKKTSSLLVVGIAWIGIHQAVISSDSNAKITYSYHDNSLVGCASKSEQLATGITLFGKYTQEGILPMKLSYDYSYNEIPCETFSSWKVWTSFGIFILMVFIIIRFRKKHPFIAFGLFFFLCSIFLVTNVFTLIGTTFADRLLYTPTLGILIAIVVFVYWIFNLNGTSSVQKPALLLVALALFFGVKLLARNQDWKSNETLFTADLKNAPNSARVHFNYGSVVMNAPFTDSTTYFNNTKNALRAFKKAIEIDSIDQGSFTNLAVCYYRLKNFSLSAKTTQKSIQLNPIDTLIYGNLGDAYFKLNDTKNAIAAYRVVCSSKLATGSHFNHLGTLYFRENKFQEAIQWFEKGLKRYPSDTEMRTNLANAFGASGNLKQAAALLEAVFQSDTSNQRIVQLLIITYQGLNNLEKVALYQKYIR